MSQVGLPKDSGETIGSITSTPPSRLREWLQDEVDISHSSIPLLMMCFNTGVDAVTFTACFVWPGFQTGNTVQLGLALARIYSPGPQDPSGFHTADAQALCSLLSFILGTLIAARLKPASLSFKSRLYNVVALATQALLTMAAAIAVNYTKLSSFATDRGTPSWDNVLGFLTLSFISMSMGVQGVNGTKLASPIATTVVLTSVYCNLAIEPQLFNVFKLVKSRELKVLAVLAAFFGGMVARALVAQIHASNTLFIGAGLRLITAAMWLFTKGQNTPRFMAS